MPHFSKSILKSDPDGLVRLHDILHGRSASSRTGKVAHATPTLAERFGKQAGKPDKITPPYRNLLVTTSR